MGLVDVGNQQTGLNADTSYAALNATIQVPPGGYLPVGMPFTRNLLAGQGNYLSKYAALAGMSQYANGDQFVSLVQSGAVLATTGASNSVGAYIGQPQVNPWLNTPAGTLNTAQAYLPGYLARSGVRPMLCGHDSLRHDRQGRRLSHQGSDHRHDVAVSVSDLGWRRNVHGWANHWTSHCNADLDADRDAWCRWH